MNIKKHLEYLKEDTSAEVLFLFFKFREKSVSYFSSLYMKVKASIIGAKIGNNCIFIGISTIYRFQKSKIIIGNNCTFNSSSFLNFRGLNHKCIIQTGETYALIKIGNNCGFSGTSIVCNNRIEIGNNVICGANTAIGDRDGHSDRYHSLKKTEIKIGDDVWLGMNVLILKGVTIGDNTIIGAGSIVTKDIPANCIAAGNPCKVIRIR